MDKIREHCKKLVTIQINKIIQPEKIEDFLWMMAKFPNMSYENILLLLQQMPEASLVCGKMAWKNLNKEIKNGERAIALFAPKIVENISAEAEKGVFLYQEIVAVYDISQTTYERIEVLPKQEMISPEQVLREHYDIAVLDDFEGKCKLLYSVYSEKEHILYVRQGIGEQQRESEYLKWYVRLLLQEEAEKEYVLHTDEMERFLLNVIYRHFGLIYSLDEYHCQNRLYQMKEEEKRCFLEQLSRLAQRTISQLSGQTYLSFEETVFCNVFFETEVQEDTLIYIGKTIELVVDKEMKGRLQDFMLLVRNMNNDTYQRLYTMRMEQKLFSYPPVNIKEQKMRDEINE